jgi:hypothetical protein
MVSKIIGWSHPSIPLVERPWTISVPWERSGCAFFVEKLKSGLKAVAFSVFPKAVTL